MSDSIKKDDGVTVGYFVFSSNEQKTITLIVESDDRFNGETYGSVLYNFLEQYGDKLDTLIANELEHNQNHH